MESGDLNNNPPEIRALRSIMGWSQTDVAKIVGVSRNLKVLPLFVSETATDKPENRKISYSAWRGLLCRAGVVSEF